MSPTSASSPVIPIIVIMIPLSPSTAARVGIVSSVRWRRSTVIPRSIRRLIIPWPVIPVVALLFRHFHVHGLVED